LILINNLVYLRINKKEMEIGRAELFKRISKDMSDQERKNWIYEHTDKDHLRYIISDMSDDEVEEELSLFK
jgi:hypothetical protein